jgi:hypothetical protein
LGSLLAPAGVRYVVLVDSLAPEIQGEQSPMSYPVPADLAPALASQLDLDPVVSGTGITVYANAAWIPERALVPGQRPATVTDGGQSWSLVHPSPGTSLVPSAVPVLPGPAAARTYQGTLGIGTLLTANAPAGRWNLVGADGQTLVRSSSFGWAGRYAVTQKGTATLHFDGGLLTPGSFLYSLVVWLAAIVFLSWSGERVHRRRLRRRRTGAGEGTAAAIETAAAEPELVEAPATGGNGVNAPANATDAPGSEVVA